MNRLKSVIVGCLIFAGCAHAPVYTFYEQHGYEKIRGQQILAILEDIRIKAGIVRGVTLYSTESNRYNGISYDRDGNLMIVLQKDMFDWPLLAVKGVLAHEMGHVVAGHNINWNELSQTESDDKQTQANAIAIKLVGEDAVRAFLLARGFDTVLTEREITKAKLRN
jgi:hypothetical protein